MKTRIFSILCLSGAVLVGSLYSMAPQPLQNPFDPYILKSAIAKKDYAAAEDYFRGLVPPIPSGASEAERPAYERMIRTAELFAQKVRDNALIWGVVNGDLQLVKLAVKAGADLNVQAADYRDRSPLDLAKHVTPEKDRAATVAYLVGLHAPSWDRRPPRNPKSLKCQALKASLTSEKPTMNLPEELASLRSFIASSGSFDDALSSAVTEDRTDFITTLLACGANPNGRAGKNSLLDEAISRNNTIAVEELLYFGADPNRMQLSIEPRYMVTTPLVDAIDGGNLAIVEALLKHKADPNAVSQFGDEGTIFPLGAATRKGPEFIKLLLDHHADAKTGRELRYAKDKKSIQLLLDAGANPNYSLEGVTPFTELFMSEFQDPEIGELLLKHGADPNYGFGATTPLLAAANRRIVPFVRLLLAYGADTTRLDEDGETALESARNKNFGEIVALLEPMTKKQQDAAKELGKAAFAGKIPVLEGLLKKTPVNSQDAEGNSALLEAIKGRQPDTVKYLLAHGASVRSRNKAGETPYALAMKLGEQPIAEEIYLTGLGRTGEESKFIREQRG